MLILRKISSFLKKLGKLFKIGLGIRDNGDGTEDYQALYFTFWIYLIGLPISMMIFGGSYPLSWLLISFGILILSNTDDIVKAYK